MAKAIMIQGTMSNAGKSFVVAGLLRVMKQDGFKVAPFKSQNMALNSFITKEGLEMGRAQVMQAEAAGIEPTAKMNPILLKPTTDMGSQVIVQGKVLGNMPASQYFKMKKSLVPQIMESYNSLAAQYDIIVIEGAGSPAEINLKSDDIVNMGMAKMADADVLLVGDIDRGGIFAQIYGTVELLEEDEKKRIKGVVINKFRGDKKILEPGIEMLENLVNKPVLGVIPYGDIDIDDEDSLSENLDKTYISAAIDIAVIRLPKLSNFTDFNPLEYMDGVSVRYVKDRKQLGNPDLIILPGTKSTMSDLIWLRESGFEREIQRYAKKGGLIIGICGGYQMLGKSLNDPYEVEGIGEMKGLGILDLKTTFAKEKTTRQVTGVVNSIKGDFSLLSGTEFGGYEIHMGETNVRECSFADILGKADGAHKGNVFGTYVHGIFENDGLRNKVIECICQKKGVDPNEFKTFDFEKYKEIQYDLLADLIRKNIDMGKIYEIIGVKI